MTRQSMRFHIIRGVLTGIVGALALGLAGISMVTSGASAQEAAACQSRDSLAKLLEERFTETPVAAGLEAGGRLVELFASADSASWTMVMTTPAGESCVMAVGEHWMDRKQPAIGGPGV